MFSGHNDQNIMMIMMMLSISCVLFWILALDYSITLWWTNIAMENGHL